HAVAIDVSIEQAAETADPEPVLAVECHACIGQTQGRIRGWWVVVEYPVRIEAGDAPAFVEQPQSTAAVRGHRLDQDLRQIRRTWPESQLAIGLAASDIAARIADPQSALAIEIDRADAVVEQAGFADAVEHDELEAVVTDQPFPGAEPQMALRGLR